MASIPPTSQPLHSDLQSPAPSAGAPARTSSSSYGAHRGRTGTERASAPADSAAFVPLALLGAAMVIGFGFQCWQLTVERGQLAQAYASQVRVVENATQFRAKLDKVARETQLLADKGNPNAKLVVEELRKRGITINPTAPTSSAPGAAPAVIGTPSK